MNRHPHVVSVREALGTTVTLLVIALIFAGVMWVAYDHQWFGLGTRVDGIDGTVNSGRLAALKFSTGYLIELSLSADNVFVMAVVLAHLRVPPRYQHRILFWGVIGALVARGVMIILGTSLIARYHWVLFVFGLFLLYAAVRMLRARMNERIEREELTLLRQLRRFLPLSDRFEDGRFVSRVDGRLVFTPLAVALVLVESFDLVFALDSIPAIFAITADPFIVFTSNLFAILGLRSLYFVLAAAIVRFRYLKIALAAILGLVGVKMLLPAAVRTHLGPGANAYVLSAVVLILAVAILASRRAEHTHR